MKNKTTLLRATRHLFYVLLAAIILQSCGNRTPIIGGVNPFVVSEIVQYDKTHSMYYAYHDESGRFAGNFQGKPCIILPSRMYQIGDTIKSGFDNH